MKQAAVAGMLPEQFYRATVAEIIIVIEAAHERERINLIGRISAILRALSRKGDPYKGLGMGKKQTSVASAVRDWIWAKE